MSRTVFEMPETVGPQVMRASILSETSVCHNTPPHINISTAIGPLSEIDVCRAFFFKLHYPSPNEDANRLGHRCVQG